MNARTLRETLTAVANALAVSEIVPLLNTLWFKGETVMAYNDVIGIESPCATGFVGALPDTLLAILRTGNNEPVSFTASTDEEVVVEIGNQKLTMPILKDDFAFKMPKQHLFSIGLSKQLIDALKTGMLSVSDDSSRPEHLGITITPGHDKVQVFATSSKLLTWVRDVPVKIKGNPERVILPVAFCEQLVKLADSKTIEQIDLGQGHAIARADDGMVLYGKLIDSPKPLDFADILKQNLPKDYRTRTVPIPDGLKSVLDRAVIVRALHLSRARTQITIRDGGATFSTRSENGSEVTETMQMKHTDIKLQFDARALHAACDRFSKILFTQNAVILTSAKGGSVHIIAARE